MAKARQKTKSETREARPACGHNAAICVERSPTNALSTTRVGAVLASAERSGLLREKTGRIAGRVSPALIERAKANTGIGSDTELLEFALANVALEDRFAEAFGAVRGTVDPELKLGF